MKYAAFLIGLVVMMALVLLTTRLSLRVALVLYALVLITAFGWMAWVALRPVGERVSYRLKPKDEQDLIDFDREFKERVER